MQKRIIFCSQEIATLFDQSKLSRQLPTRAAQNQAIVVGVGVGVEPEAVATSI